MGLENPLHIAILLLVVLLLFGAKRLPDMGRSLGDGMRGFKEAISGPGPTAQMTAEVGEHNDAAVRSDTGVAELRPQ